MSVKRFVCAVALLLVSQSAWAGDDGPDGVRFRGGISAEGGALLLPGIINLGVAGVQGQLGVQINHLIGVYVVPAFDIVFGPMGGINLAGAALIDFTFKNIFTVGAGPDVGTFVALSLGAGAAAGAGYGGRIHLALNLGGRGDDGIRRRAFVIGADLRLLYGGSATSTASGAAITRFIIAPMLTLGYLAF